MKRASKMIVAVLVLFAAVGCKTDPPDDKSHVAPPGTATNSFYLLGVAHGRKHLPISSTIVFPTESANWSAESRNLYRVGYIEGMKAR